MPYEAFIATELHPIVSLAKKHLCFNGKTLVIYTKNIRVFPVERRDFSRKKLGYFLKKGADVFYKSSASFFKIIRNKYTNKKRACQ